MSQQGTVGWVQTTDPTLTGFRGRVGTIASRHVSQDLVRHVDMSLESLAPTLDGGTSGFDMLDLCPDPLVFAINAGLPRLRVLNHQIDGGSSFHTDSVVSDGSVWFVPRIAEVDERLTSRGLRMIRTTYETTAYTSKGQRVGVALGFSLDVETGGAA